MFKNLPPKTIPVAFALLAVTMLASYLARSFTASGKIVGAVKEGNLEKVELILEKNPDLVNRRDKQHRAPLIYWAAIKDNADMCKLLLEKDADVNMPDKYGMTALHKAAVFGYIDTMKILLEQHADMSAKGLKYGRLGVTPLHLAAEAGNRETVEILLEWNADVNGYESNVAPLHMAAGVGHYEVVETLIANGARINPRDWQDRTPLHWAVHTGEEKVANLLRAYGGVM